MSKGLFHAILAYSLWGLVPLFWRQIPQFNSVELLSHRIVWSFVLYALVLSFLRLRPKRFRKPGTNLLRVHSKSEGILLAMSSLLIATNWILYIYAVQTAQVVQGSLAYFITPLLNVAIGAWFFREPLSRHMKAALLLAAAGVCVLLIESKASLEIAALLAVTFAGYGLCKRKMRSEPLESNFMEAGLLFPLALAVLIVFRGGWVADTPNVSWNDWPWLVATGLVTALPLLFFSSAARRLPFTVLGVCQFISPSLQFALAVGVFAEPFRKGQLLGFAMIWIASTIYIFALRTQRKADLLAREL